MRIRIKSWLPVLLLAMLTGATLEAQTGAWTQEAGKWSGRRATQTVEFNGRLWMLGGSVQAGGGNFVHYNDVWSSPDGVNWELETESAPWSARGGHTAAVFDGRLWVLGGWDGTESRNDVWSSTDGVSWNLESPASGADWSARNAHSSVVYDNKLWVMGGADSTGYANDVWYRTASSSSWTEATPGTGADWFVRRGHVSVVFDNKMWVIGGQDNAGNVWVKDAWSSTDGVNWTEETPSGGAPWASRVNFGATVYDNKMWISGGLSFDIQTAPVIGYQDEVWYSSDGATWTLAGSAPWQPRTYHDMETFDGKMWVFGGTAGGPLGDGWTSTDGSSWTQEQTSLWPARSGHSTTEHNGEFWTIAGANELGGSAVDATTRDVWETSNGADWAEATPSAQWGARFGHSAASFNGELWVIGGNSGGSSPALQNDVWSSPDGSSWTEESGSAGAAWSAREGHTSAVFDNKLWVIGGEDGTGHRSDVWSSDTGASWVEETPAAGAGWTARSEHATTVFDGKLWVIGGEDSGGFTNDVWSSPDGVTWNQETSGAAWSARAGHGVVEFDGRLWIIGGEDSSGLLNDAWSSDDGVNWTQETPAGGAPWAARRDHTTIAIGDTIWVMGGEHAGGIAGDVWSYSDPPQFTSTPVTDAPVNATYSYTVSAEGTPEPTLSVGPLPGWLSFNPTTGELSGTPGSGDVGTTPTIDITASNGVTPDAVQSFQIDVQGVAPQITSTPVTSATQNSPYSYTVTASGTPAPTLAAAGLPDWLDFDPNTGELSGTPPEAGTTNAIAITASNGVNPDDTQSVSIDVQSDGSLSGGDDDDAGGCVSSGRGPVMSAALLALVAACLLVRRRQA